MRTPISSVGEVKGSGEGKLGKIGRSGRDYERKKMWERIRKNNTEKKVGPP